ncbi:SDR family NAD(P)-dependent oxidoreductase [Alistipes sp. Z76]|nr:SDR family NAD(P)-dependent oxidoreductase [Alistipes sp. Z76]NCE71003.1 SDR family NAD(P)-dependent oxidoreductase [Muribaculaceae bacterium M3]
MTKIKDSCVLITGGASGIGRIMGRMALERGARKLAIWDIDEEKMAATAAEFGSLGSVATYKVDVSDHEAVEAAYARTRAECGDVDILVNCAGIVTGNRTFDRQTVRDIERTMTVNATAPMVLALQALPDMIARDHGHICNIASAAGMISNPKMSVYVASKWAVIGWSDSVRIELRQARSRVRVTTVAPYYIDTGMFDGVRSRIFPILDPEATARKILRAIERDKDFRGIPWGFHFIRFWQGVLPTSWFDTIFGGWFGIFSAMDGFTGRKGPEKR